MLLRFVRVWLPTIICLTAVFLMILRGFDETSLEGGGALIGAGLSVALLNVFFRMGVEGDRLREREDQAREFYDANGRWPDDSSDLGATAAPPSVPKPAQAPWHPGRGGQRPKRRVERPPRRPR